MVGNEIDLIRSFSILMCKTRLSLQQQQQQQEKFYLYLLITNGINNQQRGNKIQTKKVIVTQNNLRVHRAAVSENWTNVTKCTGYSTVAV